MATAIRRPPVAEDPGPTIAHDFGDLFDWESFYRDITMRIPVDAHASSRSEQVRPLPFYEDSALAAHGDSPGSSDRYDHHDTTSPESSALTPTSTSVESGGGLSNDNDDIMSGHIDMADAERSVWATGSQQQQLDIDPMATHSQISPGGMQYHPNNPEMSSLHEGDFSSPVAGVGTWMGSPQLGPYNSGFHAGPPTHFQANVNTIQESAALMTTHFHGQYELAIRPATGTWHPYMAQPRQVQMLAQMHPAIVPTQHQPDPFMARSVNPLAMSIMPAADDPSHLRARPGRPQDRHLQAQDFRRTPADTLSSVNPAPSIRAPQGPVTSRRSLARGQAQNRSGLHQEPVAQAANQAPRRINIAPNERSSRSGRVERAAARHGPEPATGSARIAPYQPQRRGGRAPGGRLDEDVREQSNLMRRKGACWICRLQRDPCDHGEPCTRCISRSQRGQAYFITCDRSKLPSFVQDFLPTSLTYFHQRQSIEDTVAGQVLDWNTSNGVQILLSSSYGPPLPWMVHEFVPRNRDFLALVRYRQDFNTGKQVSEIRWSPPFGLLKLDSSDDGYFNEYLDKLLLAEHLEGLGKTFYCEESMVDKSRFQENLLQLMCDMFMRLESPSAKTQLREVIRMLIVTYIMSHMLTIEQSTLSNVLDQVRLTPVPEGVAETRHVSPRLASRQLKYFLSIIRDRMCNQILKHFQATLRINTAQSKTTTWLESFCVMLGLAMVLEEIQRTLMIQRDADILSRLHTPQRADEQCANACQRIDVRFNFLIGLFQCKYRDRTWGENGSFGPGTPELSDFHVREFLLDVRQLLESSRDHLQSRRNVEYAPENQCLYTTRLTARFLLPFLELGAA